MQLERCQTPSSKQMLREYHIKNIIFYASRETCPKHYLSGNRHGVLTSITRSSCMSNPILSWDVKACACKLISFHLYRRYMHHSHQDPVNSKTDVKFHKFWSRGMKKALIPPLQIHHNAPSCCSAPVKPSTTWVSFRNIQNSVTYIQLRISPGF